MLLSPKALKDWNLVSTREEMISWHKSYTPWLSQSVIENLDKVYQPLLMEQQREKEMRRANVMKEVLEVTSTTPNTREEKIKYRLQKKVKNQNTPQKERVDQTTTQTPIKGSLEETHPTSQDEQWWNDLAGHIEKIKIQERYEEFKKLYLKSI